VAPRQRLVGRVLGASERTWVYFKMFGVAALIFVFMGAQVFWLHSRGTPLPAPSGGGSQ
jgi:intracellular septation protein A